MQQKIKNRLGSLENVKQSESIIDGEALTPEDMTVNLLKHQRLGLHWLLQVENSAKKGGLLADDMGLGKTIQAIALMLANRSEESKCKTNLIVAPVSVLRVWKGELETKVKNAQNLLHLFLEDQVTEKLSTGGIWQDMMLFWYLIKL